MKFSKRLLKKVLLNPTTEFREGQWEEIGSDADGNKKLLLRDESGRVYGQVPCPFLEGSRCYVYEARPIVCRYWMVSHEPSRCQEGRAECIKDERLDTIALDRSYKLISQVTRFLDVPADVIEELIPLITFEFIQGGKRYLRQYAKDVSSQLSLK